jgi:hypothetical protein
VSRREHRVDTRFRPRAVRAAAGDVDVEEGAARHHRPRAHGEAPERHARAIVHAEERLAGKAAEQPSSTIAFAPPMPLRPAENECTVPWALRAG